MKKILIADASEQWREELAGALEERHQVCVCSDGIQTWKLLDRFRPDVLIIDLMLSGVDSLSIVKRLAGREDCPGILVTGRYVSDFAAASLERFRVDDVMLKPCAVETVTERVEELLEETVLLPDPYDRVTSMLTALGIRTGRQGFRFLRTGILMLAEEPAWPLTKTLYPAIAEVYGTTAQNVEKSLRTAVADAWLRRRGDVWRAYFPATPQGEVFKPTAGQLMRRLSEALLCGKRA